MLLKYVSAALPLGTISNLSLPFRNILDALDVLDAGLNVGLMNFSMKHDFFLKIVYCGKNR